MQSIIKGYAQIHHGTFTDNQKKEVPYTQLGVLEKTDNGFNLVKVSVPKDLVNEAEKLDCQVSEILCDMKETNYNGKPAVKFVFIRGKVANPVAKAA